MTASGGRGSRNKGAAAERELATIFTEAGIPMRRTGSTGQKDGDLENKVGLYIEARRRETLSIPTWIREVADKTPEGKIGVLAFRRSREPWHVALSLDDFISLLHEAGRAS